MKETLAFEIIVLYREFLAYTTKKLKALGLSFGQMPLIVYAGKHPGCTQAELTKALKLDWGYSQRSVAKMVDSGFMTKKYTEECSCNCLNLTDSGKQAFDVSHKVFQEWDQMKMKNFSDDEKSALAALLKKLPIEEDE